MKNDSFAGSADRAGIDRLRRKATALRDNGDRAGAVRMLRALRRVDELTPGEHRMLFRALRASKGAPVLERYLATLKGHDPDGSNWNRIALALWSEGRLDALFAWCEKHPQTRQAAAQFVLACATVSAKHREPETARALLDGVEAWAISDTDTVRSMKSLARLLPPPDSAPADSIPRGGERVAKPRHEAGRTAKGDPEGRNSAEAIQAKALRQQIEKERSLGKRDSAIVLLRRLRRITDLTPAEHRHLVRALAQSGHDALVQRHARLVMAKPAAGPAGWSKLALVLWSQGKAGTLVEHAATHPSGSEAAVSAVQGFYAASVKHHEIETALRLGDYLVEQRPGDAALARRIQLLRDSAADEAADRQADAALAKADAVPSKSVAAPLGRTGAKAEQPVPPKVSQPAPGQRRIGSDWLREEREAERREQHRSRDLSEPEGAGDVPAGIADDAPISRPAVTQAEPEQAEPEKAKPEPAERAAKKETSKRKSKRDDLAGGDAFARLAILRKRVSGSPRGEGRRLLNQAFVGILDDIRAAGGTGLGKRTDDLQAIVAVLSDQMPVLARFYFDIGETRRALGLYLNAPARFLRTSEWLDAARLAHDQKDRALMLEFSRRAAMLNGLKSASQAALLLAGVGEFEAATALLREIGRPEGSLATTGAMMRLLMDLGRSREAFDLGLKAASECWPPEALEAPQQNNLISLMRQTSRAGRHAGIDVKTVEAWEAMRAAPTSALAHWCDAMVWLALDDRKRAVAALEAAAAAPGPADGINIDIAGETALVHVRYRRFGDALRTNYPLSADATGEDFYANRLRLVQEVAAFTGQCELYPECLVDVIFEEIVPSPLRYDPNPGHVVTVSGSFAQGGSERQTVNVIEAFVADGRLAGQTVLVRSTDNEDGFFKPVLDRLPLETRVYGQSWTEQSDIAEYLPELTDRPRLSRAIALLPHNIREDVVRLCRQLWDTKPETVHVRQDLHGAALACAIAGVPTFFIHRGSLSRDQWDHTPLHAEHVLRPMRHIYRKLLEHTHFFIVNNSNPGLDTDKAWLAWPDAGRFHVVHNAIDFDRLDAELPPDADVRRQLGIPEDAPVIGGVFRMAAVKRPLLWIETARLVLDRLPAAHFIIAGDFGELGEEVRAYAREHGFAERLHLPGAVTPVAPWYRAMDVLLLTSDREGLPNVNIEAQHFGVPVVSAEVGGAPETIEPDVTGFLVAPHAGAAAFADQVVRALTDTAWREHATRRGPKFVHAAFGTGQALDRLFMLYRLAPRH